MISELFAIFQVFFHWTNTLFNYIGLVQCYFKDPKMSRKSNWNSKTDNKIDSDSRNLVI